MSKALQDAYRIVHVHKGSCLALDTETTGVSIEDGDRIIEIGIVVIHRREIDPKEENHFQRYINPGFDMNEEVTKVKNIQSIQIGCFIVDTWYFSPFPKEFYPTGHTDRVSFSSF